MAIGVIEQLKEYAKCSNGNGNCEKCFGDWNCGGSCHEHAKMLLQDLDVREVKRGHWIYNTDDFTPKMRCSVCGYNKPIAAGENIEQEPSDFCNKCGADMRGGK